QQQGNEAVTPLKRQLGEANGIAVAFSVGRVGDDGVTPRIFLGWSVFEEIDRRMVTAIVGGNVARQDGRTIFCQYVRHEVVSGSRFPDCKAPNREVAQQRFRGPFLRFVKVVMFPLKAAS